MKIIDFIFNARSGNEHEAKTLSTPRKLSETSPPLNSVPRYGVYAGDDNWESAGVWD
jgi:hypothetical protein